MSWIRSRGGVSIAATLMVVGCHSSQLKAPAIPAADHESKWLKSYKEARGHMPDNPAAACEIFKSLAAESKFPGHDVAELRAVESCPVEQYPNYDRAHLPAWLQDQAIDVMTKLATARADKAAEMELAVEKSKQKLPQGEKVKWMNLAIQRAEELNSDKLEDFKQRLYKIAPRLNPAPQEKQFLSVASDYRLNRKFEKAREYYERVLKSSAFEIEDKIAALKGMRLAYKNARQLDKHIEVSRRLEDFVNKAAKGNPKSRQLLLASYEAAIYRARALWTQGEGDEAGKIFDKIEKKMKGKLSLAELYWLKGRLADERRDYESVSKYMELSLKERFTDGDLRDKIMWYAAWNERRRNNLPRAIELLSEIDQKTTVDFTRQRALFWLGRSYHDSQKPEDAKATFSKLVELDPLGYYGLLAHRQLGVPISLPGSASATASAENAAAAPAPQLPMDQALVDWLYLMDEKDALTSYLDLASVAYKKQRDQSDDGWVVIFKDYAKAGLYMKLYESLGNLTPERRKSIFEHHPELLFPQPWLEDVKQAASQFGVDEELIYAITRQESAFDTHARSLADAFGLMQLLPEVAESLSNKYKIPYTGMDDLYDPKTNISFGAAHLKELFERHKGRFILAVASYNASENVIRNWVKNRFHGDPLEFIEEIPYEETRSYVRLVMRNLIFYSLLKSKQPSMAFPDRVLSMETSG